MPNGTPQDSANLARVERNDILHRKNIDLMTDDELAAFRLAVERVKEISEQVRSDRRGFFWHAGQHGVPEWRCPHGTGQRLFLPWHRAYLYRFEQALQDAVEGVTLPWWDWTTTRGIPDAYAAEEVGGAPNTLRRSKTLVTAADQRRGRPVVEETERSPGDPDAPWPAGLPRQENVDAAKAEVNFLFFSDALQNIHNGVHGWVNGEMGDVAYAAFDLVFWAHHAMVDRLWWIWQQDNKFQAVPTQDQMGIVLEPFNMTVADTLNINGLGYDYAGTETPLTVESGGGDDPVVTAPVDPAVAVPGEPARVDIEVGGIKHSGPSFQGRVFVDNPDANAETSLEDPTFAGAFNVFGHGGCYGGEGHCDVDDERRLFDLRPLPDAIRMKQRVTVTDALKERAAAGGDLSVTIVPVRVSGSGGAEDEPLLDIKRVSIVTYY